MTGGAAASAEGLQACGIEALWEDGSEKRWYHGMYWRALSVGERGGLREV